MLEKSVMRCFININTGLIRVEDFAHFEVIELSAAEHAAIKIGRDFLIREFFKNQPMLPEFFIEVCGEGGKLLSMLPLRKVLFGEAITDRYRELCKAIPYPCLRLNHDLAIVDANQRYLLATFKDADQIFGLDMFEAFPDNPNEPDVGGVKNLSASLHQVLRTGHPHRMTAPQRYDVRMRSGPWRERYWRPINVPVLDGNGEVNFIIHHVEDVTPSTNAARTTPSRVK